MELMATVLDDAGLETCYSTCSQLQEASPLPGNFLQMQFSGPTSRLLNLTLYLNKIPR